MRLALLLALLTLTPSLFAQQSTNLPERCYTMQHYYQQVQEDSDRGVRLENINKAIDNYLTRNGGVRAGAIVTIPVVIHIAHNGDPVGTNENISDAQAISQIDVLNEDFRRMNADTVNTPAQFQGVAADTKIEFCLAQRTPDNLPTTGIERHQYTQASWSGNDIDNILMPQTIWDRDQYLNLYVVNFTGGGLLGYAQLPGGPANTDAVVIGYQYFGSTPANPFNSSYDLGRTGTHEVGHWLGLEHIWGDGPCGVDDGVSDTPESDAENFGCPSGHISCGSVDMIENYMDYTDDACMNIFTAGQGARMQAAINTSRPSLLGSAGCQPVVVFSYDGQVVDSITQLGIPFAEVLFKNGGAEIEVSCDASGHFSIPALAEDTYDIYGGQWGYNTRAIFGQALDSFSTSLTLELTEGYYDDFTLDLGWSVSGNATTGQWVRGEPVGTSFNGTPANPDADVPFDYTDKAYVTGNNGGGAGNDDVDDGNTLLTSPAMDLSTYSDPYIYFSRWFFNDGGTGTPNDSLIISLTDGSTTKRVVTVHQASALNSFWVDRKYRVSDYVTPGGGIHLVVETYDQASTGHLVEAGLDKFYVQDSLIGTQKPVAGFVVSDTSICAGEQIAFADNSTNGPNTILWEFPGGLPSSSMNLNPKVTYPAAGTYTVRLFATNNGGSDSVIAINYIVVHPNPQATLSSGNISCAGGTDGSITATASGGAPPYLYAWSNGDTTAQLSGLGAGSYTLTVTDTNGCQAVNAIALTAPAIIILNIQSTPDNGSGGSATVTPSGGTSPYTYQWNDPSSQITPTATGLTPGNYSVTVTDHNGCKKIATVTVGEGVGIALPKDITLSLSPVPAGDMVSLFIHMDIQRQLNMTLYDVPGKALHHGSNSHFAGGTVNIDVSDLPTGLYLLRLQLDDHKQVLKIVVAR